MKKLHIILMDQPAFHGTNKDEITVYTARGGTKNEVELTMYMQGVLPSYRVLSHVSLPFWRSVFGLMFPSLDVIKHQLGKKSAINIIRYYVTLPLSKLFRGSTRKNKANIGYYDTKTFRVYAVPDGQKVEE